MVGGGLGWRRRGGEEGFGIIREVLRAVGGVEAFWEDDKGGACFGGLEDFGASVVEVGGFVGACKWGGVSGGVEFVWGRFWGRGKEGPVANWIRASFRGFLRRVAILVRE